MKSALDAFQTELRRNQEREERVGKALLLLLVIGTVAGVVLLSNYSVKILIVFFAYLLFIGLISHYNPTTAFHRAWSKTVSCKRVSTSASHETRRRE